MANGLKWLYLYEVLHCLNYINYPQFNQRGSFNVKVSLNQYGNSLCGEKVILGPYLVHNGNSYIGNIGCMISMNWNVLLILVDAIESMGLFTANYWLPDRYSRSLWSNLRNLVDARNGFRFISILLKCDSPLRGCVFKDSVNFRTIRSF